MGALFESAVGLRDESFWVRLEEGIWGDVETLVPSRFACTHFVDS